jgi:hypothetical protein
MNRALKWLLVYVVLGALVVLFMVGRRETVQQVPITSPNQPTQAAPTSPVAQSIHASEPESSSVAHPLPTSAPPQPADVKAPTRAPDVAPALLYTPAFTSTNDLPAQVVLENMRVAIRNYGSTFGGNPVGTNPEITQALAGGNSKQIQFLNADSGLRINSNGELVDPWGTPFFFHQLSGSETEIHSAGPDRKLWTSDDLVIK